MRLPCCLCVCAPSNNCFRRTALSRERLEKSGIPVGYSERAAVRREKFDMLPERRNNGARRYVCY
jgi:hypothetical protein